MLKGPEIKIIGLTGGAGAGKSEAASMFRRLGARVIDADRLGHELLRSESPCFPALVRTFGRGILKNGRIDRRALGHLVFKDKRELGRLNRIVHPQILKQIKNEILKIKKEEYRGIVVIDAALLVQWGWDKKVDYVVAVTAPVKQRLQRMTARGRTLSEARRIMASQLGEGALRKAADFAIVNDKGLDQLRRQVRELSAIFKHR
jgi:dephospho-CoA kinase